MKSKSLLNFLGSLSDFQFNMLFTSEDDDICRTSSISSSKRATRSLDDFQIFTDHLKLSERFKKTLYYGKLPGTECPSLPLSDATIELFTKTVPNGGLDVLDMHYAASVSRKACISPCSMILAIMYLDQLRHKNPEYLQNVASCDLFLISMLVASKFLYDNGEEDEVFNAEWACSANIDVKDINKLEREFLAALDWEVFVKPAEFFSLLHDVECKIALSEVSKRGWFTYTDAAVISDVPVVVRILTILVDNVIKVIVILSVAYVAAVLTLFGASIVCQKCIPLIQSALHMTKVNIKVSSLMASNNMLDFEMTTSIMIPRKVTSFRHFGGWDEKNLLSSDGLNETASVDTILLPRISAFNKTDQAMCFLQGDCKDYLGTKSELFAFTNESADKHFTPGASPEKNCFIMFIKPCFPSAVSFHSECICSSHVNFWLLSVYNVGYSCGVCEKRVSKSLKE